MPKDRNELLELREQFQPNGDVFHEVSKKSRQEKMGNSTRRGENLGAFYVLYPRRKL